MARNHRVQFTIGHLMIAVAAVAVVLALRPLPRAIGIILVAASIPCLAVTASRWLVSRRRRRLAARSFWAAAILINLVVADLCIAPDRNTAAFKWLHPALWFVGLPTMIALGVAWALLTFRDPAVSPRSREATYHLVFLMAVLPLLTLWTLWPLRLAFLAVRPSMDRLADQVAAGRLASYPPRVGLFRIAAPTVEPVSGFVGLKIAPRGIDTGFVRIHGGSNPTTHGPIVGVHFNVHLGGGWWYRG